MSLPDGEYDLDVSILTDTNFKSNKEENVAIKDGVILESKENSKSIPIQIYQEDLKPTLLGLSSRLNKQILSNGTSKGHDSDKSIQFYLTYTNKNERKLKLNRLVRTIGIDKVRTALEPLSELTKPEGIYKQDRQKRTYELVLEKDSLTSPHKRNPGPAVKRVGASSTMKWNPKTDPLRRSRVTTRRPQSRAQQQKATISESDFEISDKSGNSSPIKISSSIHADEKVVVSEQQTNSVIRGPVSTTDLKKSDESKNTPKEKQPDKAIQAEDLDDDFKDLEDQLQELLGEEEEGANTKNSDSINMGSDPSNGNRDDESSGSDADEGDYENVRFQNIQFENNTRPKKLKRFAFISNNQKPVSLRDFVGRGKTPKDAGSSSEEE